MIIIYLAILTTALYGVLRILLPEMAKPPLPRAPQKTGSADISRSTGTDGRIEKLEVLLAEKNKNIKLLQDELTIFLVQLRDFEKIKSLLVEEIHRLREQNRIFRSELGLPATQPKETSLT